MPRHNVMSGPGMSSRRIGIIGGVAMLHVLIVYALINGMAARIMQNVHKDIVMTFQPQTPEHPTPPPPEPPLARPTADKTPTIVPPDIPTENDTGTPITVRVAPPTTTTPSDANATGLTGTHTTPPYPDLARKLGQQGTVLLQIVVSAQGNVTSATVVQSSGYPDLDAAAAAWVQAHWRYNPAVQGGVPAPSQTRAAVKFDIRRASL
ncbi:MAG TPA: energy transducer TonB [Rhizomicrobium sp.]|nr:energy transducer TonB [Rhizomicrobium sp.]